MRAMKSLKYLVPNGFTATSMLFGLASVVCSSSGQFELAAWMILWGVLLDKLDGSAARLLNASSEFGMQFDSFADFVIFGIAPAALFFFRLREPDLYPDGTGYYMTLFALGIYVVATSSRLARFNISEPPGGDQFFFGIPTTLVGAALASGYLTVVNYGYADSVLPYVPYFIVVFAFSMVSNIRLPKLKSRKNKFVHWFQVVNLVLVYAITPFQLFPEYLFILMIMYLAVGLTWALFNPVDTSDTPSESIA